MGYDIIIGRDKSDKKIFKDRGLIYLGKVMLQWGNTLLFSNKIWLDIARTHVILIAGKKRWRKKLFYRRLCRRINKPPKRSKKKI